jgi:GT2 family glycosyltransferase/glycosyltransferase involved in cell wall biosynthesis
MRIAYVTTNLGPSAASDVGAYLEHVTRAMLSSGHEVYLVTSRLPRRAMEHIPAGVRCLRPLGDDRSRRYFSPLHEYSDRVYKTLLQLNKEAGLDVVEFAETGTEGFTTIRAKRLLGEFPRTQLVMRLHEPLALCSELSDERHLTPERSIQRYAEEYCARHADAVTAASAATAAYVRDRFGLSRVFATRSPIDREALARPLTHVEDVRHIRFIGDIHPVYGADLFLRAALRLLQRDASFSFTFAGRDTPSDPFGDSYRAYLERSIPPHFRDRFTFEEIWPYAAARDVSARAICVFPRRWGDCTYDLLATMLRGGIVVASCHGAIGELVSHGQSGMLVDPDDPAALEAALFTVAQDPELARRIGCSARTRARRWSDPTLVSPQLLASYRPTATSVTSSVIVRTAPVAVSVVIPLYNQGHYLQDAVDSIRASSHHNVEIVVVNDGSTDPGTNATFAALTGIVKISQPNRGLGSARNAGILASSGEMILTLDADDVVHPRYIEDALHALLRNPDLAYVTCYTRNFGLLNSVYVPVGSIPDLMLFLHTDGKSSSLYRKQAMIQAGGYDELMPGFEDWELQLRMNKIGFVGDVLPRELFYYRRHPDSMVFKKSNSKRIELLQYMIRKHQDLLARGYLDTVLQLVYLWKCKYEPSESVALQEQLPTKA